MMLSRWSSCFRVALVAALSVFSLASLKAADKKVLFIAGPPSHGAGFHEYNAGLLLFQKCLAGIPGLKTEISLNGWPRDAASLAEADAVVLFSDGGPKHPALQDDHLAQLEKAMARGAGLGVIHYAVEPTRERGQVEFLRWLGGAFEVYWSVNPHWDANFTRLPVHPITRGVQPFTLRDEWYFQMRFVGGMKGVTPLLVAVPAGPQVTARPDGDHGGNPAMRAAVARGDAQTVSWAYERADGGRGWAYTGGHFHKNWGDDNARKLVLNAILWLAKLEVPDGGVQSVVTPAELAANLDVKPATPLPSYATPLKK